MKFTNGVWLMRDGVRASYATEARDVVTTGETVTVHAATRAVRHRGDALYGPVLTTHWWTPAPDVIAVRTTHFAGGRPRSTAKHAGPCALAWSQHVTMIRGTSEQNTTAAADRWAWSAAWCRAGCGYRAVARARSRR